MKRKYSIALFPILLASILFAGSAAAQPEGFIEIRNVSGEKRKICMYSDNDALRIKPIRCSLLNNKEKTSWEWKGLSAFFFRVKVFRPGLIDILLETRRLGGTTYKITLGKTLSFDQRPAAYHLKICNRKFNQDIFVAIGFETNEHYITEGWWRFKKGKCGYFNVSQRLNKLVKLDYGYMPRIHYYAETRGASPQYWSGGANGKPLCVGKSKPFELINTRRDTNIAACHATVQRKEYFRLMDTPKINERYFLLYF